MLDAKTCREATDSGDLFHYSGYIQSRSVGEPFSVHPHTLSCLHSSDGSVAVRSPDTRHLGTVCRNTTQAITLEQLTCKG